MGWALGLGGGSDFREPSDGEGRARIRALWRPAQSPSFRWHSGSHTWKCPCDFRVHEGAPVGLPKARRSGTDPGSGTGRPGSHLRPATSLLGGQTMTQKSSNQLQCGEDHTQSEPAVPAAWPRGAVRGAEGAWPEGTAHHLRRSWPGLGGCQEHPVINQQVRNGKLNSKGGRREEFFIGLLSRCQRFFPFLPKAMSLTIRLTWA